MCKYGTFQSTSNISLALSRFSIPFLIASWCDPEKAVKARSPAYGCLGCTGIREASSTNLTIEFRSEKSNPVFMPRDWRFIARIIMSRFPVRSPCPNNVPSTRSPPAISAISVAAMAHPWSLWACRLIVVSSCWVYFELKTSIMSAYWYGGRRSTVAGRFSMNDSLAEGPQAFFTASQTSTTKSMSESVNSSGENS